METQIKEEWRPVVGYEGLYEISNLGNVKSLNYHREKKDRILNIYDCNGYKFVNLYKDGNPKKGQIHRLVAMAFIPNPNNFPIINHKDENLSNNRVENLEWCDYKYNTNYGNRVKKFVAKKNKRIVQLSKEGEVITEYSSFMEAQEKTGLQYTNISKVCRGLREFCGGYRWKYFDKETEKKSKRKSKEEKEYMESMAKKNYICNRPVFQYTKNGQIIQRYDSIYEASENTGVARRVIVDNCMGKNKSTRKYIFKFA